MYEQEQREVRLDRPHFRRGVFRPGGGDDWHVAETYQRVSMMDERRVFLDSHGAHIAIEPTTERTYFPQSQGSLDELARQVLSLQRQVSTCLEQISSLSEFVKDTMVSRTSTINSIIIDDKDIVLARPLFFLIEEYIEEEEVVARIPELQADGFGSTEMHAINELKVMLGELYQDLVGTPDGDLGRMPLQSKRILEEVVGTNATKKL